MLTSAPYCFCSSPDRPVINVNRPPDEVPIYIPRNVVARLQPHQLSGVQHMWDTVVEDLEHFKANPNGGSGCILAHAMGLGKTLQIILFLNAFYRHTSAKKSIVVAPVNTLINWQREFVKWLPVDRRPVENQETTSYPESAREHLIRHP